MIQNISAKELKEFIDSTPETLDLIDVRGTGEFAELRIPTARNIPLHVLPVRMNELDSKKKIIFICRSGGRSAQATMLAQQAGVPAWNLSGGMNSFENDYPENVVREKTENIFSRLFG